MRAHGTGDWKHLGGPASSQVLNLGEGGVDPLSCLHYNFPSQRHSVISNCVATFRSYGKALGCCVAMREACVAQALAAPFNTFLQDLKLR